VCLHYYVHPLILEKYREGRVIDAPPPLKKTERKSLRAALRRDEVAVLDLLELR